MNTGSITNMLYSFRSTVEVFFIRLNNPEIGVKNKNSHIRKDTGKPKMPLSKIDANREALRMQKKGDNVKPYKCPKCGAYHVGHCPGMSKMGKFQKTMLLVNLVAVTYDLYQQIKGLHK